uniref:Ion transport domain-containing protein n=1 Tax=Biomphalaria glabrata TaxID=6526 RepID=A0A2C9K951_BIOGL
MSPENYNIAILVLGGCHNFMSLLVFISYFVCNHPRLPSIRNGINACKKLSLRRKPDDEEEEDKKRKHVSKLDARFFSVTTFYYMVGGTQKQNKTTSSSLGIYKCKSLLWVGVLGLVVFYLYGMIGFALMRSMFNPGEYLYCNTLWQCTITVIRYGLIGDLFEFSITAPELLGHLKLSLRRKPDDEEEEDKKRKHVSKLDARFFSVTTFYYMAFLALSVGGTYSNGYFFAFHLLNIVNNNQLLSGVIKAVTQNGKSLLWVGVLGLVVFYLYGMIGFALMRSMFNPGEYLYCNTLWQCTITVIRYGLIGDLFEWTAESDMRDTCFICSRNSYDFEHHGKGFDHHVRFEHNMWSYIFFFIHLNGTKVNDYTALEMYVFKLIRLGKENYDFFPLDRALSLASMGKDATETKLDDLLGQVTSIVEKQRVEVGC